MRDWAFMAAVLTAGTAAADDCHYQVFHRYCLGGSVAEQIGRHPPDVNDKELGIAYVDGDDLVVIMPHEGRVMAVIKTITPGTWLEYQGTLQRIEQVHGAGVDQSHFPDYAKSESTRSTAIALGKGRAQHAWDKGAWRIVLSWSDTDSLTLFYLDSALDAAFRSGNPDGL